MGGAVGRETFSQDFQGVGLNVLTPLNSTACSCAYLVCPFLSQQSLSIAEKLGRTLFSLSPKVLVSVGKLFLCKFSCPRTRGRGGHSANPFITKFNQLLALLGKEKPRIFIRHFKMEDSSTSRGILKLKASEIEIWKQTNNARMMKAGLKWQRRRKGICVFWLGVLVESSG